MGIRPYLEKNGAKCSEVDCVCRRTALWITESRGQKKNNSLSPLGSSNIFPSLCDWFCDPEHFLKVGHTVLWIQSWHRIYYGCLAAALWRTARGTLNLTNYAAEPTDASTAREIAEWRDPLFIWQWCQLGKTAFLLIFKCNHGKKLK